MRSNQRNSGPRICVFGSTKKRKITEIDHFFCSSFSPFSGFKKLSISFMNVCLTQPSLLFERVRFDQLEKFTSLFLSQKRVSILSPTGQIRIGLNLEFFFDLFYLFFLYFFFTSNLLRPLVRPSCHSLVQNHLTLPFTCLNTRLKQLYAFHVVTQL